MRIVAVKVRTDPIQARVTCAGIPASALVLDEHLYYKWPMTREHEPRQHRFGGDWTEAKLSILREYLGLYTQALKNQPFDKIYIDAFAGTGYRSEKSDEEAGSLSLTFFDLAQPESQQLLDGSARIALKTTPAFDGSYSSSAVRNAVSSYGHSAQNSQAFRTVSRSGMRRRTPRFQNLCQGSWRSRRAVLFLDPYGMQVEWRTIAAIATTKAIDLWILFPLGIGVNRLLKRSGQIPAGWRRRLDTLLGTTTWYDEFYPISATPSLFPDTEPQRTKASTDVIGRYFVERLRTVFEGVADSPAVLTNSSNCPLYLLCFAVGNKNGAQIALRLARSALKKLTQ